MVGLCNPGNHWSNGLRFDMPTQALAAFPQAQRPESGSRRTESTCQKNHFSRHTVQKLDNRDAKSKSHPYLMVHQKLFIYNWWRFITYYWLALSKVLFCDSRTFSKHQKTSWVGPLLTTCRLKLAGHKAAILTFILRQRLV